VVDVAVRATGGGTYRLDVTVSHDDEGWDHYADGWEVIAPEGAVLATWPSSPSPEASPALRCRRKYRG
jgi:hypothetical protein